MENVLARLDHPDVQQDVPGHYKASFTSPVICQIMVDSCPPPPHYFCQGSAGL